VSVVIDKKSLETALSAVSVANKDRSQYTIETGKNSITVKARGVAALKTVEAKAKCETVEKSLKEKTVTMSTSHLLSSLSKLQGEKIVLSFTEDEMRVRVEDPSNKSFVYLLQRIMDNEA